MKYNHGDKLCNCTLLQKCGSGAYGEVWLAEDVIGTRIALKILRGKYSEREVAGLKLYKDCNHPNLLKIRYVEINDGLVCYTMDAADDLNNGQSEYQPDTPWTVELPYKPATARYTEARRNASSTAPEFAPGSKVSVSVESDGAVIKFPKADHKDGVFYYQLELFRKDNGKWVRFSRKDVMGDFDLDLRPDTVETFINNGYFESNKEYRIDVAPRHIYGKVGKKISGEFVTREIKNDSTVVFESHNPMKDCPFLEGLASNTPVKLDADGYYDFKRESRLVFPDEIWAGPTYTQFRVTVKMHGKQGKLRWTLTMRNPKPTSNGNNRFYTEPGDNGVQRYVVDMYKSRHVSGISS